MKSPLVLFALFCFLCLENSIILQAEEPPSGKAHPFGKREHLVQHMNGAYAPTSLPAEIQWVSEPWFKAKSDENAQMPYLVYMPEKDRVLMLVETQQPIRTAFIYSDDRGQTWSERKWLHTDADGKPKAGIALGLTYLGGGKLFARDESVLHGRWVSTDYGENWELVPGNETGKTRYVWDPLLVKKDAAGKVIKLLEASYRPTGVAWGSPDGFYSQGYFRTSTDEGSSWSVDFKVPQWLGVNEVNLIEAPNGDLVAACRTDYPSRYAHNKLDHFGGLAVSISKDQGKSWSKPNPLYEWGRHHPSMVVMPNGDIVMSYVVRLGYPANHHGDPQFGVEAVVSHDNGKTWNKEQRYVLASWVGNITGGTAWFCGVQSTSTVLLPDGMLLTTFGTGFRNLKGTKVCKMDIALVRWRLESKESNTTAKEK